MPAAPRAWCATPPTSRRRSSEQDAFGYNLPNWLIRREMVARLTELPGAALRAGVRVERVTPRTDAALAALSDGTRVRAALVVAADGRDSAVREALGIGVRRWGYGQKAVVFAVSHERPHSDVSTEIHRSGGPFTLVPLADGTATRVGGGLDGGGSAGGRARGDARGGVRRGARGARLRRRRRAPAGEPAPALADRRAGGGRLDGPRTALVAEAAHVVPPIGAQGLNMSLADVATLLDLCRDARDRGGDIGAPELLARYHRARHPDILLRMAGLDLLNRAAMAGARPLRDLRRAGLAALHGVGPVRRAAMRLGLGMRDATG